MSLSSGIAAFLKRVFRVPSDATKLAGVDDPSPTYLRNLRKSRWNKDLGWLKERADGTGLSNLPADAFVDLKTEGNRLSVWKITEDNSNFARVVAAFVSTWNFEDPFDYVLLPKDLMDSLATKREKSSGKTLDGYANDNFHFDLTEISASDLVKITEFISRMGVQRLSKKKVLSHLDEAISSGLMAEDRLADDLRKNLIQYRAKKQSSS